MLAAILTFYANVGFPIRKLPGLCYSNQGSSPRNRSGSGIVAQVDEFGVKHDSGLFIRAVKVMGGMKKATTEAKVELYKSYGWSELDIISAFRKFPHVLAGSDQNIRITMSFLINEVRYKPIDITLRPALLSGSLEKGIEAQE
ncbi:hypothetical protein GIB67_016907 [Kingdonia uniflora]|uniref:Uncharacterized protein n=1 Tax=Kingdonia uniflora TaxID=39325 RepID=A0A7J7M3B1_9MAGN|nr:hypothetical protein GIB67_016907 [Kingdonia uniflora]